MKLAHIIIALICLLGVAACKSAPPPPAEEVPSSESARQGESEDSTARSDSQDETPEVAQVEPEAALPEAEQKGLPAENLPLPGLPDSEGASRDKTDTAQAGKPETDTGTGLAIPTPPADSAGSSQGSSSAEGTPSSTRAGAASLFDAPRETKSPAQVAAPPAPTPAQSAAAPPSPATPPPSPATPERPQQEKVPQETSPPATTSGGDIHVKIAPPNSTTPEQSTREGAAAASETPSTAGQGVPPQNNAPAPPAETKQPTQAISSVDAAPVTRSMEAPLEQEFSIAFPGEGWVYLGATQAEADVSFLGKTSQDGNTTFHFKLRKSGSYTLEFQLQDFSRGTVSREGVRVRTAPAAAQGADSAGAGSAQAPSQPAVNAAAANTATGAGSQDQPAPAPLQDGVQTSAAVAADPAATHGGVDTSGSGNYDQAYRSLRSGRKEQALAEFKKAYDGADPQIADTIARLARDTGDNGEAARYWQENAGRDDRLGSDARQGLLELAVSQGNHQDAEHYLQQLRARGEKPEAAALLGVARQRAEAHDVAGAIDLYQQFLKEYQPDGLADRAYFELGRLYESNSSERNMRKSLGNYRMVTDNYPLSPYWDAARERIEYLNRHFFQIR